ncbi:MAG TPA: TetR/AcrR family transcriptional regulator [Acidimicrobiales bacterium]|nr:TetR/AcrR family transcriptional regulator [Acidimicrobiales bacterium]
MDKRSERSAATRRELVDVAVRLFGERGYDGTSIEAVLAETGMSRGSLYHHFAGKQALFEAALDAVEQRIGSETAAAAVGASDAVDGLRRGCLAWVRLAGDPAVRRVVLIDAPSVLGWQRWREIEEENALGLIKLVVQQAADEGRVPPELVDVFAHVVLATVNEVALLVARAGGDGAAAQRTAEQAVDELLRRLFG